MSCESASGGQMIFKEGYMKKCVLLLLPVVLFIVITGMNSKDADSAKALATAGKEGETKMAPEKGKTVIQLPAPRLKGEMSLEECIYKRRSIRSFESRKLTLYEISQLLWAMQGITDERLGLRAAPSAGALYPLEIYVVKDDGVYHYDPHGHRLEVLGTKDVRDELASSALGQSCVRQAAVNFVICAVYERVTTATTKYGEKGVRFTDMEAGHAAQNLHLEAVALGLASVPVGAFMEEGVAKALSLPKGHRPIYILPVGEPVKQK